MKTMQNFIAQQLTKKQMNGIRGGATSFSCHCAGMANPGYAHRWVEEYERAEDMIRHLNARCESGDTCEQGTELWSPFN